MAMMKWMIKFVQGIKVSEEVEQRLRRAKEKSKEAFREENVEIFGELIREIRKTTSAAGIHMGCWLRVGCAKNHREKRNSLTPAFLSTSGINKQHIKKRREELHAPLGAKKFFVASITIDKRTFQGIV